MWTRSASPTKNPDPWDCGDYDDTTHWPMGQDFVLVSENDGIYTYLAEFTPGMVWDPTWIGKRHLVMGLWETLSYVTDKLPDNLSLKVIGNAANSYVFNSNQEVLDFDVLLYKRVNSDQEISLFNLEGIMTSVARGLSDESAFVRNRAVSWTKSGFDGSYVIEWTCKGLPRPVQIRILPHNGTLKEYMTACQWGEDSIALAIKELPPKGNLYFMSTLKVDALLHGQWLHLTDAHEPDPSVTISAGMELCKLSGKRIHMDDFNTLVGLVGLQHDEGLEFIGT